MAGAAVRRCAIYTRKSSEEGLEQDYNSLHAQREACEAFVRSQALNVLLSFAQFEREVIGERIRDKVAASKRKGIWMGGTLPMGYDVRERKLVINQDEVRTVREIFERYLELGTCGN